MNEQYHIKLTRQDTARFAILPGDPGRVEVIASYLDNPTHFRTNREFTTYQGTIDGEKVLVISTGIGAASAAICAEELANIGVEYLIRVGTCGGMQREVAPGDVVIANGAIRMEGTSKEYMPLEFPAVADFDVIAALKKSAEQQGFRYHMGVAQSKDSFYGQHCPDTMPIAPELKAKWQAWIKGGCLCSEMESSVLFIVGAVRSLKTGACFHCVWNQEYQSVNMQNPPNENMEKTIKTAIEAIRILIAQSE